MSWGFGIGIAFPKSLLEPKNVLGGEFKYQKVFGEDQFIAAGVVFIPVGGSKPGKYSKDNSYVSKPLSSPQVGYAAILRSGIGVLRDRRSGTSSRPSDKLCHGSRSNVHGSKR